MHQTLNRHWNIASDVKKNIHGTQNEERRGDSLPFGHKKNSPPEELKEAFLKIGGKLRFWA